jgi:UDP:flavonoid glycosyltransferase YjiC (YdhE family)
VRVLFATTRGAGHFGPLVPFAHACGRAGHDVLVAAPASLAGLAARAGLPFREVPEPPAHVVDAAFAPVWARSASVEHVVRELFAGLYARTALPGMLDAVADWRPDVVVRESMEFASAVAAEVHGVPQARVGIHLDAEVDASGVLEELAAPVLGLTAAQMRDAPVLSRSPVAYDGVLRYRTDVPPARDPDVVYVTFGSEAPLSHHFPRVFRDAIEALAGLPVLMTIGDRRDPAELGPLPPSVRVERWVSQAEVMPRALAMVSHGGSGSTLAALAAGVPQAFVPLFVDGPANAERVAELGAGIAGGDLRAAVHALLERPRYRHAARTVAAGIAALPPIDDAIEVFARVSSQARTRVRRDYRSAAGHAIR